MLLRRAFLLACAAAIAAHADTRQDVADLAGDLAAALADDDPEAFLGHCAKNMPHRDELRENVAALVNGAEVTSAVEILDLKESGARVVASLDWSMRVQAKGAAGPFEQRHDTIILELERQGKKWRIVGLGPINFFRPQRVGR